MMSVLSLNITMTCFAQFTVQEDESIQLELHFEYNDSPVFLEIVPPNTFNKTKAEWNDWYASTSDPYKELNRFRTIGTANVHWQSTGLYEIIIYTNNFRLEPPPAVYNPIFKIELFSGLYVSTYDPSDGENSQPNLEYFVPLKIWTPSTAGKIRDNEGDFVVEQSAPHNNGIIPHLHWYGVYTDTRMQYQRDNAGYYIPPGTPPEVILPKESWAFHWDREGLNPAQREEETEHQYSCYTYVPDKFAIDFLKPEPWHYGSYKKVIAGTRYNTWPFETTVTFAVDLKNDNFVSGKKYYGEVFIDLIGN